MSEEYVVCYSYGGGSISGEWGRYATRQQASYAAGVCRQHWRGMDATVWIETC